MSREFTLEEPQQQGDEDAAGEEQLDQEVRAVFADLFHACSLRRAHSRTVSARGRRISSETRGPICPAAPMERSR
jgi:hypothetical protein